MSRGGCWDGGLRWAEVCVWAGRGWRAAMGRGVCVGREGEEGCDEGIEEDDRCRWWVDVGWSW